MILWFAGLSAVIVWAVFRDPRIDFRFVAAGALVPLAVDAPWGEARYGHTLVAAVGTLVVVVLVTLGRRPIRSRLVMVPVGMLLHLVLGGLFSDPEILWWPLRGADFPDRDLVPGAGVVALREAAGLAAVAWFTARFGLGDRERRRDFLRSGQVQGS